MPDVVAPPLSANVADLGFNEYEVGAAYDEMFTAQREVREPYRGLAARLQYLGGDEIERRRRAVDLSFLHRGITFTVYGREEGIERVWPYDLLPRLLTHSEWQQIESGLGQRLTALNLFLKDLYTTGKVLKDRIIPPQLVYSCAHYRREMRSVRVPHDIYVAVCGTDLVRLPDGSLVVLEDNLRVPSGVSYMLANREVMKDVFPVLFADYNVASIEHYPEALLSTLRALAPTRSEPTVALLTPGVYNSAYFEHTFLARQMGIELVEGHDLLAHDNIVYMRTTAGLRRVDVLYRRIDDDFIDPLTFRNDSMLGVPGLFNAYRAGNVALANAVGTGVADDKAIYAYVPRMIKYYLDQEPILQNVETYICDNEKERAYVLDHLDELVVKAVGEAGGYGMMIGPHSSKVQHEEFRRRILENPRNYIAQPTLGLSRGPCFVEGKLEPRCVDLRPFTLFGEKITVVPGGLTRVALQRGSLVVNSSQGGGSKDTWVLSQ